MQHIVGLFNLDGRPAVQSDLATLAAASRRRVVDGDRFWLSSCVGLGQAPAISASGVAVSFDARIDDCPDLAPGGRPLHAVPMGVEPDGACILAAYEQRGDQFASDLNGDFAIAIADPGRRQVLLARDVMGARRLHYTRVGNTLLFASEIKSLLAYPGVHAVAEEDAIADLVLDRWIDGTGTGFRGIHSVPPGHTVVATPEAISVHRHWGFDPTREIRYRTADEYVDHFRELFEQAVRRRMRASGAVAVSVSGGVDSSAIFCQAIALQRAGPLPAIHGLSTTFPLGSPADEQQFLDVLEASSGASITRLPLSRSSLIGHAAAYIEQSEMPAMTWTTQNQLLDEAQRLGCTVLMSGYFGDQVLFPRTYLVELARRGHWLQIRRHLRQFKAWTTDAPDGYPREFWGRLLRSAIPRPLFQTGKKSIARRRARRYPGWYTKRFIGRVIDRQMSRLPPAAGAAGPHAMECHQTATAGHYLFQVQRQSADARTRGLEAVFPFRDRDLVAFLMAIPGEVVSTGGVPKGLARRALTAIVPTPVRERRWKADFTEETNHGALDDFEAISALLTRSSAVVAAGFADGGAIENAVRACRTALTEHGDGTAAWKLSDLVALELWLQRFHVAEPSCTTS